MSGDAVPAPGDVVPPAPGDVVPPAPGDVVPPAPGDAVLPLFGDALPFASSLALMAVGEKGTLLAVL